MRQHISSSKNLSRKSAIQASQAQLALRAKRQLYAAKKDRSDEKNRIEIGDKPKQTYDFVGIAG